MPGMCTPYMSALRAASVAGGLLMAATLLAPALAPPAWAQDGTVIYRCTDAGGAVTLRNGTPCPKGSKQERRQVDTVPTMQAPQPVVPATPAPVAVQQPATQVQAPPAPEFTPVLPLPQAQAAIAQRLPPPPLYQCNTPDNDSYLSDNAEPKPRCVRVETVGIDGSQSLAAGQACRTVFDQCERIGDNAACPAWRKRVNEAQAAWTFARADAREALKTEYDRIARVVAETTCNQ